MPHFFFFTNTVAITFVSISINNTNTISTAAIAYGTHSAAPPSVAYRYNWTVIVAPGSVTWLTTPVGRSCEIPAVYKSAADSLTIRPMLRMIATTIPDSAHGSMIVRIM